MPEAPKAPAKPAKPAKPKPEAVASPTEVLEEIKKLVARLRLYEQRFSDLRAMVRLVQEDLIRNHKRAMDEIKVLSASVNELKRTIAMIENRMLAIIEEIKLRAKYEDVEFLKKYINLWSLVKFATVEQVERMIKESKGSD